MTSFMTPLQTDKKQKCITLDELFAKKACSPKPMSSFVKDDPPALDDLLVGQVSESPDYPTRIKSITNIKSRIPKAKGTETKKRKRVGKIDGIVTDLSNDDDCATENADRTSGITSGKKSSIGIAVVNKAECFFSPNVRIEKELDFSPAASVTSVAENHNPSGSNSNIMEAVTGNENGSEKSAEDIQNIEVDQVVVQEIKFPTTPTTNSVPLILSDEIKSDSITLKSSDSILSSEDADDKITDSIVAEVNVNVVEVEVKKRSNKRKTPEIKTITSTPGTEESSMKRERVSKPSAKKRAAQMDELDEIGQLSLLEPSVRTKLECYRDRERLIIDNLIELESAEDLNDRMIGIEQAKQIFIEYLSNMSSLPKTLPPLSQENKEANVSEVNDINLTQMKSTIEMEKGSGVNVSFPKELRTLIARFVQGSSEPLSQLASLLSAIIKKECSESNTKNSTLSSDTFNQDNNLPTSPSTPIPVHWYDIIVLQEEIKAISTRTCYGFRNKSSDYFEDKDKLALWRWETQDTATYLDATSDLAVKEIRLCRRRCGKAIQKSVAVTQILLSTAASPIKDITKLTSAEEFFTKSYAEVEKAKTRRLELQKKKAIEQELKQKKELEKEMKMKEKEEEAKKKEEARKEKENEKEKVVTVTEKPLTEKQIQEAKILEKQKSLLKSFFVAKAPSTTSTAVSNGSSKGSSVLTSGINRALGPRITLPNPTTTTPSATSTTTSVETTTTATATVSTESSISTNVESFSKLTTTSTSALTTSSSIKDQPIDSHSSNNIDNNNNNILSAEATSNTTSVDTTSPQVTNATEENPSPLPENTSKSGHCHQHHNTIISHGRQPPRKPHKLTVSVEIPTSAFGLTETNGVELKDVLIDSKMKFLSFCQDYRPPYWGTFSKKSKIITGRNPFAKDTKLFDYDFDSEAEWEEDDVLDGEDIAVSDNEEDGEGNELEYDDFFRRDNDFGSDLDSDEEAISAAFVTSKSYACKEVFGPMFIDQSGGVRKWSDHHNNNLISVSSSSKEIERMKSFVTVLHYSTSEIPKLGCLPVEEPTTIVSTTTETNTTLLTEKKNRTFRDELLPELIRFIHGRKTGIDNLVEEFWVLHKDVAKSQIKSKIKLIAAREGSLEGHGSSRWIVKSDVAKDTLMEEELPSVIFTPPRVKTKRIRPIRISGITGSASTIGDGVVSSSISSIPLVFGKVIQKKEEDVGLLPLSQIRDNDGNGNISSLSDGESGEGEGEKEAVLANTNVVEMQTTINSISQTSERNITGNLPQIPAVSPPASTSSPTTIATNVIVTPKVTLFNYFKANTSTAHKSQVTDTAMAVTSNTSSVMSVVHLDSSGCEEYKEVDDEAERGTGGVGEERGILVLGEFPVKGLGMTCPITSTSIKSPLSNIVNTSPISVDLT